MTAIVVPSFSSDLADAYRLKGSVGDGSTDDTTAVLAAQTLATANGTAIVLPGGTYSMPATAASALVGPFVGRGQIKTSDGNKLAPYYSVVSAAPAVRGTTGAATMTTAFNGSLVGSMFKRAIYVTGGSTLGTPTTGYLYTPEAALTYDFVTNDSGYQYNHSNGDGRTSAVAHYTNLNATSNAFGDTMGYYTGIYVTGNHGNAGDGSPVNSIFSQPAGALYCGLVKAGHNNVGLTAGQISLEDNGFDARGVGWATILNRTVTTGSNAQWWEGSRTVSTGTGKIEVGHSLIAMAGTGGFDIGFSTAGAIINHAAYAMAAGQSIEFAASMVTDPVTGGPTYPGTFGGWTLGVDAGANYLGLSTGGVDNDKGFRIYGGSATVAATMGVSGSTVYINAHSTASSADNTSLAFRTHKSGGFDTTQFSIDPSGGLNVTDGNDFILGTTTGTKFGTATTQKLGFYGTTATVQPAGSTDVLASLVTLGLRAASSNPPLDLGTGTLSVGTISVAEAHNIATGTTTGTIIAGTTSQKLGFWGTVPKVKPATGGSSATVAGSGGTTVTTGSTFDGYTIAQITLALRSIGLLT